MTGLRNVVGQAILTRQPMTGLTNVVVVFTGKPMAGLTIVVGEVVFIGWPLTGLTIVL